MCTLKLLSSREDISMNIIKHHISLIVQKLQIQNKEFQCSLAWPHSVCPASTASPDSCLLWLPPPLLHRLYTLGHSHHWPGLAALAAASVLCDASRTDIETSQELHHLSQCRHVNLLPTVAIWLLQHTLQVADVGDRSLHQFQL